MIMDKQEFEILNLKFYFISRNFNVLKINISLMNIYIAFFCTVSVKKVKTGSWDKMKYEKIYKT